MSERSDLSSLLAADGILGLRYTRLRDLLAGAMLPEPGVDVVALKQELEFEMSLVEGEIRQLRGFELFNLPPSGQQLKAMAAEGPLVCFNVTKWRCNAFIVASEAVESIPLPSLAETDLEAHVQNIVGSDRLTKYTNLRQKAENNKRVRAILSWLWDVAVMPVLAHLQIIY